MPDREPEPWETNAAAPFLRIEGAPIEVWAHGEDRYRVKAPGQERIVVGFDDAQQTPHALAEESA